MAYTYSDLKTDIRNYTEVDSNVLSDSILTSIVKKAETKIYRSVDTDEEREYATSVLATGNRYVTIPTDLRAIRYVQLADTSTTPNKQVYLEKRDTSFMAEYYNTPSNASGFPKYYANWDEQFWVVAPTPDQQYAITLAYIKQPTSITTSDSQTTDLSNKYEDLLLYASLVEVYGYLKGPADMLNFYQQSYREALETYALEQQGLRRRDEYMDGSIRVPMKTKPPSL
jgi:hypothetical protein|tara:strand:+ start:367 stop:1047 length:681 start_codon:yes stop_codon:yes gene_type:complete